MDAIEQYRQSIVHMPGFAAMSAAIEEILVQIKALPTDDKAAARQALNQLADELMSSTNLTQLDPQQLMSMLMGGGGENIDDLMRQQAILVVVSLIRMYSADWGID